MPYHAPSLQAFERMTSDALEGLPSELGESISNVDIVVEERPSRDVAEAEGADLLGLYQGIPLTERDGGYFGLLPDRIVLYRYNIEREATSETDLKEVVRRTVIHEFAHHFGIDDDRLEELGWD